MDVGTKRRHIRSNKFIALVAAVVGAAVVAAVGLAGVWNQTVQYDGNNVRLRVVSTSAGNFDSGWHIHPGLAIVQVLKGSLAITQGSCTPKVVSAGDTYVELPYVPVRAVGLGEINWTTSFVIPYGVDVAQTATSPCP